MLQPPKKNQHNGESWRAGAGRERVGYTRRRNLNYPNARFNCKMLYQEKILCWILPPFLLVNGGGGYPGNSNTLRNKSPAGWRLK